jgi:regulatory protein
MNYGFLHWILDMSIITALEIQKRNKERVNVYLDHEFAFGLTLMEAAKLRKGQTLTAGEITVLTHEDAINQAVNRAIDFLSYRPRSSEEVRRNLVKKNIPETVVSVAMERLQNLEYLDDIAFARFWIENRDTFKPMAPRALRFELRQKGIGDDILDPLFEELLDVQDSAYRVAKKQLRRYKGKTRQEFKHKLSGKLQRRGFDYGIINDVIHRLLEELNESDPDYFALDEGE